MVLKNETTFTMDNEGRKRKTEIERKSNEQEIRLVNEFSVDECGIKSGQLAMASLVLMTS